MKHRLVLLSVVTAVLLLAALPSAALAGREGPRQGGGLPTLFAGGMSGRFTVRPAEILTESGATTFQFIGEMPGKGGRIRWQTWTTRAAHGVGTIWTNDCIPSTAEGTWHGRRATIDASQVRKGRYVTMTIRFRGDPVKSDADTTLHVERYRLSWSSTWRFYWGSVAGERRTCTLNK